MGDSKIEWTDKTWNPVRGCSVVSSGCKNCYAMNFATRFAKKGEAYEGLAYRNESGAHWTGKVKLIEEHLEDPLRWRTPRRIFVNSMSDLFHEAIPDRDIEAIFGVMASASHHIFQVLTKRPERMRDWMQKYSHVSCVAELVARGLPKPSKGGRRSRLENLPRGWPWPLPNVWLGTSVEDQKTADERIPLLLQTPTAVRFISYEPALAGVDLSRLDYSANLREFMRKAHGEEGAASINAPAYMNALTGEWFDGWDSGTDGKKLDWVIAGAESGPGARPMDQQWIRAVKDQCVTAGVAFFYKQDAINGKKIPLPFLDGRTWNQYPRRKAVTA